MKISAGDALQRLAKYASDRTPLYVTFSSADGMISVKLSGFVRGFKSELISFSDDATMSPKVRPGSFILIDPSSIVSFDYGEPREFFPDSEKQQQLMEARWGPSMMVFTLRDGGRVTIFERLDLQIGP